MFAVVTAMFAVVTANIKMNKLVHKAIQKTTTNQINKKAVMKIYFSWLKLRASLVYCLRIANSNLDNQV